MPALIDPIVAALAAAIVGASGSPAAVPSTPPASCEQGAHTRATAASHPAADEVVEKIRALVAEITARARSGAAIDVPSVAEELDRANLPRPRAPPGAPRRPMALPGPTPPPPAAPPAPPAPPAPRPRMQRPRSPPGSSTPLPTPAS